MFINCGRAMYGERWQTYVAADLRVSDRTVRRWASGSQKIPGMIGPAMTALLLKRHLQIKMLLGIVDGPANVISFKPGSLVVRMLESHEL